MHKRDAQECCSWQSANGLTGLCECAHQSQARQATAEQASSVTSTDVGTAPQHESSSESSRQAAAEARSSETPSSSGTDRPSALSALLQSKPALARKVFSVSNSAEAAELLLAERPEMTFQLEDAELLIQAALERSNIKLALSIYDCCAQARKALPLAKAGNTTASTSILASTASVDSAIAWPAASLATTDSLVLGLCRQLAIDPAIKTVADIRVQGLPRNDAVGFGKVISSPLAPSQTLTVVQPQEGLKVVADAFSRYEYEVFSGRVVTTSSEALQPTTGLLFAALRAVGVLRRPAPAAVHEFVVQAPDGVSRTFRVATASPDVPAQVRVCLCVHVFCATA